MKIDTAGTYTLRYSATDQCGNVATKDRVLTVAAPRTVLYTDGTFVINESPGDKLTNEASHGAVVNEYPPLDPNGATSDARYEFSDNANVYWNNERTSIVDVIVGSQIQPKNMGFWFVGCRNLATVDTLNLDTSECESFAYLFSGCQNLQTINVSNWNTSHCANMKEMFAECLELTSIDVSNWDTSNVTNMNKMFGCRDDTLVMKINTLDVSNWNTQNVTDMSLMFKGCEKLAELDTSSWNTSNVTTMQSMFDRCLGITVFDISGFDTSNVTNMNRMFAGTYYSTMYKTTTIYASDKFVVGQVTNSVNMFAEMSSVLVGGAGTRWSSSNPTDKTYAHIDGGTSNPGYFTAKPTA